MSAAAALEADVPSVDTPHDTPSTPTPSAPATPTPFNPFAPGEPGGSRPLPQSVIDKWLNPEGPPRGATFGARRLGEEDDVFSKNAWDHAELPEDFSDRAASILSTHAANPVPEPVKYNDRPAMYWNKFYKNHQDQFFKNRRWLPLEFPELVECCEASAGPKTILEVGCGAGNTVFPLRMHNENPQLRIVATDYSSVAVGVVQKSPLYAEGVGEMHAAVWDITAKPAPDSGVTYSLPEGVEPGTVDVLSVIYVLSALHPDEWKQAVHNLYTSLRPGGTLLVRDYGRHDLAQLRIRHARLLDVPNLYIRGDGTRVYFFEKEELGEMLTAPAEDSDTPMFTVDQLAEDRRLLVNRKEKLQMYRIWLQAKATKL